MTAIDFSEKIMRGPMGLSSFERYELVFFHKPKDVIAAYWTLACLANPNCEGSEETLQAIIGERKRRRNEAHQETD